MITDVSSVGLDFLYLRTEKPIFLTDRRNDRAELTTDAPISAAADIIDASTIGSFASVLAARLDEDALRPRREELRRFYFGDLAPGESTQRFLTAVGDVITKRDELLSRLPQHHAVHAAGAAAAAGDMGAEEDEARFAAEDALHAAGTALAAAEEALESMPDPIDPDPIDPDPIDQESMDLDSGSHTAETSLAGSPVTAPSAGGMQIR
jgi:hypothetical protein